MADGPGGKVRDVLEADAADDQDGEDEAVEAGGAAAELGGKDEDEENGQSSISDTVTRTGLAQSKVSTSVAKLRDRGWVQTSPDSQDGRKTLAEVTKSVQLDHGGELRALPSERP